MRPGTPGVGWFDRAFWLAFAALALAKAGLAAALPLFGDEAWYWLEGRHLAWAYSDLPGLTAWLIRFGTTIAGDTAFGVRWPFLVMAMALPLLVAATARAWFGDAAARRAAWLALLMPLAGALGFLALPDVPMTLAAALCLLACARMTASQRTDADRSLAAADAGAGPGANATRVRDAGAAREREAAAARVREAGAAREREAGAARERDAAAARVRDADARVRVEDAGLLALGLVLGALSHYRFALIVLAGFIGLLLDANGRRVLRSPLAWAAIALGALAWWPLLAWNLAHHGAGLEFQLAERHPWSLHAGGLWFVPVQLAVASPLIAFAGALVLRRAWRARGSTHASPPASTRVAKPAATPWGVILGSAGLPLLVYGVLAFVADRERVSFHWTLQAWLPLLCAAPLVMAAWPRRWRIATHALAVAGLLALLAHAAIAAWPAARARFADSRWYPDNFAGWHEIAVATRDLDGVAADNFMLGAQLAFARGDAALPILDHPLNRKHGRAVQLALWGQGNATTSARWLVVEDSAVPLRDRLAHYHALCDRLGDLPIARVVDVDHGRKRFLVLDLAQRGAACRAPALAWIDAPAARSVVPREFNVAGWAFKDGAGIARVEITLDGKIVAQADYGAPRPHVAEYWRDSRDPAHPRVGFDARVDATGFGAGEHWLGLVLHGRDGSVETWPQQRIELR